MSDKCMEVPRQELYLGAVLITKPEVVFPICIPTSKLELRFEGFGMSESENQADTSYEDIDIVLR